MAVVSKPVNSAFILKKERAQEFMQRKNNTALDALRRFGIEVEKNKNNIKEAK